MSYRFIVFSLLSISALFLGSMHAFQQDQRQPIGQRSGTIQSTELRQPVGENRAVVIPQPGQQTQQVSQAQTAQAAQKAAEAIVPKKKKKSKKDKSRQTIGEKNQTAPVVVVQPKQHHEQAVVNVPVPIKKEHRKKDKSRQTLGERSGKAAVIAVSQPQPRQEIGQKATIQTPIVVPQQRVASERDHRQMIGERARPIQKAPVAVGVHQPVHVNSVVAVPTPPQCSERPNITIGFERAPVVVSQPQRPIVVQRPLPQVIVIDRNSAAYNSAVLTPFAISPRGDNIQLDDGSTWQVRHRDQRTVRRWNSGDVIVIEAGRFFSWSTYRLMNYTSGTSVDVELIDPACNGMLSRWITEINPYEGYLRLQDGSVWRMSTNELLNWNVNDDVIIALSKNWFSNDSSYVLINPRVKTRLVAVFNF